MTHPTPPATATDGTDASAIAGYYDDYSTWYDSERRFGYYELINDLEVERITPALAGRRALEVGCGTGLLLERTTPVAATAVGVDLSPGMAGVSAAKGLTVANASATGLPFRDGAFDVAYSCKVLPHVPDLRAALAEMARVVAPGGRLFVELYNPRSWKRLTYALRWRNREAPVFVRFDTAATLRPQLPTGWEIRSVRAARTFGPTRHFYTAPGLRRITSWLDRRCCDTRLGERFGGYLLFELAAPAGR